MGAESDTHRLRGPVDAEVLSRIRDAFVTHEPLATATVQPDLVNPTHVEVELSVGLGDTSEGRFDVQWTTAGDYKFHYTETGLDFRWGHHPHGGEYDADYAHFHPPPDASSDLADVEPSCFTVHRPTLLVRGVLTNWRTAFHNGLAALNRPASHDES